MREILGMRGRRSRSCLPQVGLTVEARAGAQMPISVFLADTLHGHPRDTTLRAGRLSDLLPTWEGFRERELYGGSRGRSANDADGRRVKEFQVREVCSEEPLIAR